MKIRLKDSKKILSPPKKRTEVTTLITKIEPYSAIKIRANPPALYSMLKPETISDSPSAKSKGARLVSARVVTNQIKETRLQGNINQQRLI